MKLWNKVKNSFLLKIGAVLVNKHGYKVWLEDGKQKWDNPNRKRKYSLDDNSWRIKK
jgi:hypothetical protein